MEIDIILKKQLSGPNQPVFLTEEELKDPFLVVSHYFNGANVHEFQRELSAWIYAVFGNYVWNDQNPGELVFFYRETMKLIEAAFAIHILKGAGYEFAADSEKYFKPLRDRNGYGLLPHYLTPAEEANPHLVLAALCEFELGEYRETLLGWLEWALQKTGIDNGDELYLFDLLQKLIEAIYLLNLQVTQPNEILNQ